MIASRGNSTPDPVKRSAIAHPRRPSPRMLHRPVELTAGNDGSGLGLTPARDHGPPAHRKKRPCCARGADLGAPTSAPSRSDPVFPAVSARSVQSVAVTASEAGHQLAGAPTGSMHHIFALFGAVLRVLRGASCRMAVIVGDAEGRHFGRLATGGVLTRRGSLARALTHPEASAAELLRRASLASTHDAARLTSFAELA